MTIASELQRPAPASDPREVTLLRAVGWDRLSEPQRELATGIARNYDLDPMLRHLVLIEGKPYITRDGLLHVAHRSGQLDGIETTEPVLVDGFWRSTCSVYRKDMGRPFTYTGRYPEKGGNAKFAPEMAVKVGEVMALRRAFDVAAPTAEERWDADVAPEPAPPRRTLAERVAERHAAIEPATPPEPPTDAAEAPSAPETPEPLPTTSAEFVAFVERHAIASDRVRSTAAAMGINTRGITPDDLERLAVRLLAEKGAAGA